VTVTLTVTACGASALDPDPAACKAALQAQYLKAAANGKPPGAEPALCRKLPQAQVRQFAAQLRAAR
jgi:hypothetical protein